MSHSNNALYGLSLAVAMQLGMLAGSAQTNKYLFSGSETNITLNPGTYIITAYGAPGGANMFGTGGGLGAEMSAEFNFSAPTTLTLLVGGGGNGGPLYIDGDWFYSGGGGGGGTFVVEGGTPLVIAGGGGGIGVSNDPGLNGNVGTSGGVGRFYPRNNGYGTGGVGGTNGYGGPGGISEYSDAGGGGVPDPSPGGGGGGFLGGGGGGTNGGGGGGGYEDGGSGGYGGPGDIVGGGGYGGGGGGGYKGGGGGGGGYSGGGGGSIRNSGYAGGGAGGSSIIYSSAIAILTEVSGIASPDDPANGEVIITAVPTPLVITTHEAFGFTNGVFGFSVVGPSSSNVVIQASTDLRTWIPLQTNLLGSGLFYFSDPRSPANVRRFYRAQLSP